MNEWLTGPAAAVIVAMAFVACLAAALAVEVRPPTDYVRRVTTLGAWVTVGVLAVAAMAGFTAALVG